MEPGSDRRETERPPKGSSSPAFWGELKTETGNSTDCLAASDHWQEPGDVIDRALELEYFKLVLFK
ncbi:hypothetical protein DSECCO2_292090 [anaerobic digester metagenome]